MLFVRQLVWDGWNVEHIARHGIAPEEVEEVCHQQPVFVDTYNLRVLVIGPTVASKMVSAILAPKGDDCYYPVTARSASRKERKIYESLKGGDVSDK